MPIDAYSLCPGGTGKKIKFCCPDFLGELETIERMLEGEQYLGCLNHVETLLKKHPDKACLLARKCLLLRASNQVDALKVAADAFLAKHPGNPIALAEHAMLVAVEENGLAAMKPMQAALAASGDELPVEVYEAVWMVAQLLAVDGHLIGARAWTSWLIMVHGDDPRPSELLARVDASPQLPLWAKDERQLAECSADAPWKSRFDEALGPLKYMQCSEAAERLAALAQEIPDAPAVWRSMATLRAWTADDAGAVEALRRFAALDVPLEDAVEAEALAMYLSDSPLGDAVPSWRLSLAVHDVDAVLESFAAAGRLARMPLDASRWPSEEGPPPKAFYSLADRADPTPDSLQAADMPKVMAQVLLFGRETDRAARLELVRLLDGDRAAAIAYLAELGGAALGEVVEEENSGDVSQTQELLAPYWRLPQGMRSEQVRGLAEQYREHAVFQRWPTMPLGCLGGRSAQEAAADPAARVRVLAAVLLLEFFAASAGVRADWNRLRRQLGLPELGPIDPGQTPIKEIPLARQIRVEVEKLSDESLLQGFQRTAVRGAMDPARRFATAIVERPTFEGRQERFQALNVLIRTAANSEEALAWIDRARQDIDKAGRSNASIDILELSERLKRREAAEASRLLSHIERQHIREPGVASAVESLLIQAGVLTPDGRPPAAPGMAPAAMGPAMGPEAVAPAVDEPKSGELWVPDGAKPDAGEKSKLWVPGMD